MKKACITLLSIMLAIAVNCSAQESDGAVKSGTVYMVADAHMDTQWNWDVQTTIRSYIWDTMVQNFHLFRQYPDYIFNFEGGVKYAWMKEYYPTQFAEVKDWVSKGRWHISGSSWDACETIICSPESWIRNILLGQTFYRQEFGVESTDVFLPDCFGFPYTLPTLARHCGLIGFSSQKLMWRSEPFYEGNRRYPFTFGRWKGIDGSELLMAHGFNYAQRLPDEDLSKSAMLQREVAEHPLSLAYRYYGTGDMGGSPTVGSVRGVMKGLKGSGPLKLISATSDQIYKDFIAADRLGDLPSFDGELYMDLHGNGCYTSQAAMKLYNRQNEHLGDAAERSAVIADWAGAYAYPIEQMTETWRRMIWHQFHDDVTGTSIPRAYEFSWNDELISLKQFANVLTTSIGGIARQMDTQVGGTPVVVYNNETYAVRSIVKMDIQDGKDYTISDAQGRRVKSQSDGHQLLFEAEVPATGVAVYSVNPGKSAAPAKPVTALGIENSVYRLKVDAQGDIVSLVDKRCNRELVAQGKSIRLVCFDDCRSEAWPAWEIQKRTLDKEPRPIHEGVNVELTEDGPLRKTLRISKRMGKTVIRQDLHLYEGGEADRIDFETTIDWAAENALLKAEFPLGIANPVASYDLGLGCVERGNNRKNQFEVYSHEWTDLTDASGDYGLTILNDSRYGWDKPADNTLRLSLLYAPKPGRGYVYQAHQDKGHHVLTYSIIGHQGALDLAKTAQRATLLNSPLRAFTTTKHKGQLGRTFSFASCNNPNVLIRTLKRAEVSDEYVVRVHELSGKTTQTATLTFASDILSAEEADGTEKTTGEARFAANRLTVDIKPFSVKTYKLKLRKQASQTLQQQPLPLAYDKKCATFNAFRSEADFEGGYSYAAELLPDQLTVDGITFSLGEKDAANGKTCKGDTLPLPAGYNRLYLLAASNNADRTAEFAVGSYSNKQKSIKALKRQTEEIPFYSGFIGQWGHTGQTTGYLKQAQLAYVGGHRHSPAADEPYEFTYMFKIAIDLPKGATHILLPRDEHVILFAATLASETEGAKPAAPLFQTSNTDDLSYRSSSASGLPAEPSLLKSATLIGCSGYVNERERPEFLTDGNAETKWCDVTPAPNFITYDLGSTKTVSRWHLINAGSETSQYITRTAVLQGRNSTNEEWKTLDLIDGNSRNEIDRQFTPQTVRYVRLYVVGPTQSTEMDATRIYEMDIW